MSTIKERLRGGVYGLNRIQLCEEAANHIELLELELRFYRSRVKEFERWQSSFRDPERTVTCDILANGSTFHAGAVGTRYGNLVHPDSK